MFWKKEKDKDKENKIYCDTCRSSKFGKYLPPAKEKHFCLLLRENLKEKDGNTIPCKRCGGNYYEFNDKYTKK